jgi:hypothetical protein
MPSVASRSIWTDCEIMKVKTTLSFADIGKKARARH